MKQVVFIVEMSLTADMEEVAIVRNPQDGQIVHLGNPESVAPFLRSEMEKFKNQIKNENDNEKE